MAKLYNLARMTTPTTGTGTITLGSAVTGFLSFVASGVSDGETITYAIQDGSNSEIGRGVYTASGTTLTRSVLRSTNSNAAISLSGTAQVFITPAAEDIVEPPSASVDSELALFSGTTGKVLKRASTTGLLKATAGVLSAATAGTDYLAPGSVGFRAHKGGTDQTGVADVTFTKVTFGTENYDNGGYFASSAWTPPAGLVSISAAFLASGTWSAGALIAIAIRKNASTTSLGQANWYSAAANAGAAFISVEDDANGTDYYEVFAYVDVGSGTATIAGTSNNTYFVGHVIK